MSIDSPPDPGPRTASPRWGSTSPRPSGSANIASWSARVGPGHQWRDREIAQPLARCEEDLAVAVGDECPWVDAAGLTKPRPSKRSRR